MTFAFRINEANAVRSMLAEAEGSLALAVSPWFFDEVIRQQPTADPSA